VPATNFVTGDKFPDKVAVKLIQYGTRTAKYKEIGPTNQNVTVPATNIMLIVDGKVKEWWAQLGSGPSVKKLPGGQF
jgi:predicted ester cyclase